MEARRLKYLQLIAYFGLSRKSNVPSLNCAQLHVYASRVFQAELSYVVEGKITAMTPRPGTLNVSSIYVNRSLVSIDNEPVGPSAQLSQALAVANKVEHG